MTTNRAQEAARTLDFLLDNASPCIPGHILTRALPAEDGVYVIVQNIESGASFQMTFHAGAKLPHLVTVVRAAAIAAWGVGE